MTLPNPIAEEPKVTDTLERELRIGNIGDKSNG